jgi:hypothetical protein
VKPIHPRSPPLAASWHLDSSRRCRRRRAGEVILDRHRGTGDQKGERQTAPLRESAQRPKQRDLRPLWTREWWRQQRCFDGAPGVRPAAVGAPPSPARASTLRRSASPLCFFGGPPSSQRPRCAQSENIDQTLTLTCQKRRRRARRACLSSAGACWHSPGASPRVQDRAAWMKYGPLQFCFA